MIISAMIICSRFFGFFRYRILVGYFTKEELDIFFAAFRIPDLIFEVLITGALTSAFIPIFIKYQKDKKELYANISSIINVISVALFVFVIVMLLLANWILPIITPGFTGQKLAAVIFYSKILLVGQLPFMIFASFLTGIGQANKTFILTAFAPLIYNLAIIVMTILFAPSMHLLAPVIGVVVGAVLSFVIQLPLIKRSHFEYAPIFRITRGLCEFFGMIVPRLVTTVVTQIDATIDLTLTTLIGSGSYTVFYLAQTLQLLPVSIIGIAFGQASLPYLSELYQDGKVEEFKKITLDSLLSILFFTIPLASFFIFARTPLVRLFFGGQKFDWDATTLTATTLSYFALSIPFHSIYYFITRCFYGMLDSRTPFYVSLFTIATNIGLSMSFVFIYHLPVWALAISFSITIVINVIILFALLIRRIGHFNLRFFVVELIKITTATFVTSFFVYYLLKLLDGLVFDTSRTINVFLLLMTGLISFFSLYLLFALLFEIRELYLVSKLILKAKQYHKRFFEIYTQIDI